MTTTEVQTVDSTSRLLLPREFANATVRIEKISDSELRIHRDDVVFLEEQPLEPLSDRDRDFFLNLLDNPPEPTPALRAAVAKYRENHG